MAHHGKEYEKHPVHKALAKELRKLRSDFSNNAWPNGMMAADDDGVLPIAIGVENERVVIRFAEPCTWIGFSGKQAREIAKLLQKRAAEVEEETKPVCPY